MSSGVYISFVKHVAFVVFKCSFLPWQIPRHWRDATRAYSVESSSTSWRYGWVAA